MTTNHPQSITIDNLLIGDRLVPKEGHAGRSRSCRSVHDNPVDFIVQPLVVRNMHRGDKQVSVVFEDGTRACPPLAQIKKDWVRA